MNSCLYDCQVMHNRLEPKKHRFNHRVFMFLLDLDELDELPRKIHLFSRNRFNVYNFCDSDHLLGYGQTVRENLTGYLKMKGVELNGGRVLLLTNVRTFGYIFNPVSFYYCFDKNNQPLCVVPEIGNTFGELKPYLIDRREFQGNMFESEQTKYFYISPFIDLDATMKFQIKIPGDRLEVRIDDYKEGKRFFLSTLTGERRDLTNKNLLLSTLRYPLVTLKVIALIHAHALRLYLKKVPFHPKEDNPHLQREVNRVCPKN